MAVRISPQEYFAKPQVQPQVRNEYVYQYEEPQNQVQVVPRWVPIIICIALIGSFAVAMYAISKLDKK